MEEENVLRVQCTELREGLINSRFRLASAQNTENLTDRRLKI